MRHYELIFGSLKRRALISLPFLIILLVLIRRAVVSDNLFLAGMLAVPALVLGLFAAIVLSAPIAELLAEFSVSILFDRNRLGIIRPAYSVPESKRAWAHYEEAISEYEKIAEEYPNELKPYVDMIEIAMVKLKDPDRAARIYEKGMARLADEHSREVLSRMYLVNCSRIKGKPEWLKQQEARVIEVNKERTAQTVNAPEPDGKTARRFHAGGFNLLSTEPASGSKEKAEPTLPDRRGVPPGSTPRG